MKVIVELIYRIVKKYMIKAAEDTGNQQFTKRLLNAFKLIEDVWSEIQAPRPKDNTMTGEK